MSCLSSMLPVLHVLSPPILIRGRNLLKVLQILLQGTLENNIKNQWKIVQTQEVVQVS
jgi:hypothetical protein